MKKLLLLLSLATMLVACTRTTPPNDNVPAKDSLSASQSTPKESIVIKKSFYGCKLGLTQREDFIKNVRKSCRLVGDIESTDSYVNYQSR